MTTTTDRQPLTDRQLAEIKQQADVLTRAIEADWQQASSAHSLDYWLRCTIDLSRKVPALLATVELLRKELDLLRAELPRMCVRVRVQVAQELRDRSAAINTSGGTNNDPLADAIWDRCHRHPEDPATFDDPRRIAQVAYEHIATTLTEEKPDA